MPLALPKAFSFLLVFLIFLPLSSAAAPETTDWRVSSTRIAAPGELKSAREGTLRSGMMIEGRAETTAAAAPFAAGTFRIKLSAFSPRTDLPGQKKGRWYLHGDWTIIADDIDPQALKARYSPYTLSGVFNAELREDPLRYKGPLSGDIRLQRAATAARSGRSSLQSRFTGETPMNGLFSLPLFVIPVNNQGDAP